MKKRLKKLLSMAMAVTMMAAVALTGCGGDDQKDQNKDNNTVVDTENSGAQDTPAPADVDTYGIDKTAKIGVLVSDASTAEAIGFRAYYEDYLANQYDIEFIYSEELADAEGEISAIENFISQGCNAVISFSSFDRPGQIETCDAAQLYYAVATGVLTDEQYETYKGYEYYVGSIGPSLQEEFDTGYAMAEHFIGKGDNNFLIFGGAAAYGTEMHIYRAAGMLAAMCVADESGATTYSGATDQEGIIGAIYSDMGVDPSKLSGDMFTISYVGGYNMDDAWFGEIAEKLNTPGVQAVLAVGNGSDFFSAMAPEGVEIGSVDTFVEDYKTAMDNNQLHYLAGKFAPSNGPIVVAVLNALNGAPIRTADGSAFTINQGYWVATSADECATYLEAGSVESPAYTKDILDKYVSTSENVVSFDTFESFVGAYSYDEIQALK